MIDINLLSKELKTKIGIRRMLEAVNFIFYVIFSIIFFVSIIMFAMDMTLAKNVVSMEATREDINRNYEDRIKQVREINDNVKKIQEIQSQFVVWSDFLHRLSLLQTDDVLFKQVSANYKDRKIIMSGTAKTRDSLIVFKNLLSNSDLFTNIELPLSSILEKENIEFTITAFFDDI